MPHILFKDILFKIIWCFISFKKYVKNVISYHRQKFTKNMSLALNVVQANITMYMNMSILGSRPRFLKPNNSSFILQKSQLTWHVKIFCIYILHRLYQETLAFCCNRSTHLKLRQIMILHCEITLQYKK